MCGRSVIRVVVEYENMSTDKIDLGDIDQKISRIILFEFLSKKSEGTLLGTIAVVISNLQY